MEFVQILPDKRILVEYGPITMVITIEDAKEPVEQTRKRIAKTVYRILEELAEDMKSLKSYPVEEACLCKSQIAQNMWGSVKLTGHRWLTPMAAVAGSVADEVADVLAATGAGKIIVNNGGDISIRIKEGHQVTIGVRSNLGAKAEMEPYSITCRSPIRGIATSGFGGRSYTQGVADSLTVFAGSASVADAFATYLANMTHISSKHVKEQLVGTFDPESDIADQGVVTEIGDLDKEEIERAFSGLERALRDPLWKDQIYKVICYIAGCKKIYEKEAI